MTPFVPACKVWLVWQAGRKVGRHGQCGSPARYGKLAALGWVVWLGRVPQSRRKLGTPNLQPQLFSHGLGNELIPTPDHQLTDIPTTGVKVNQQPYSIDAPVLKTISSVAVSFVAGSCKGEGRGRRWAASRDEVRSGSDPDIGRGG